MSVPSAGAIPCLECGATNMAEARRCWLCSKPIEPLASVEVAKETDPDNPFTAYRAPMAEIAPSRAFQSTTLLVLAVVTLLVLVGIALIDGGAAVGYAIVLVPALLATYVAASRREARGTPLSPGGKVLAFVLSIMAVTGILLLLAVAAAIALFLFCLMSMR